MNKRFAISITDESININLIGQFFRGKILKEDIEDVIYYPKTKQIGINIKNPKLFLTKIKNPFVRYSIRRNIKRNKSHIYIKSDFTTQNITEIKLILDELGYSKAISKTNILKLIV